MVSFIAGIVGVIAVVDDASVDTVARLISRWLSNVRAVAEFYQWLTVAC